MPEKDDKGLRNAGIRQLPLTYQTIFLQMMMFLVSIDIISAAAYTIHNIQVFYGAC